MIDLTDPNAGRSMSRYMGLSMRELPGAIPGQSVLEGVAPAPRYLRSPNGNIALGAVLTLADSVGGLCAGLAALPGWVVTTNLMLRSVNLDVVGPIGLSARILRAGKQAVVTEVLITDLGTPGTNAAGLGSEFGPARVAEATLTSAVLRPDGGPPTYERPLVLRTPPIDPAQAPDLRQFLGVRASAPNQLTMAITDQLRNPWGIVHGGATAGLVDLTGVHATGGSATTDAVLHFLSPGRVGPVAATAIEHGRRSDGHLARIEVRDTGADDRLMAVAVTTVRPI